MEVCPLQMPCVSTRTTPFRNVNSSGRTSAAKLTERFRRPDYGNLYIDITVDDSKAYTRPWTATLHQHIQANTELLDFFCEENEKDIPHLVGK